MVDTTDPLPAPDLPQMTPDQTVSLNDLKVSGGLFVRIHQYEDAARGDYIDVSWDENSVKQVLVNNLSSEFPIIVVITDDLGLGEHFVKYKAQDTAGNTGTSIGIVVKIIDGEPEVIYPAPVFTDAVRGVINQVSITTNAGTHVYVAPYAGIMVNDTVLLFWSGMNASGEIKENGVESQLILTADVSTGATFLIPEHKLQSLQDKGTVMANYQIRRSGAVIGLSEFSKADLDLGGDGSNLKIMISTGAANTDYDAIHLYPFNQGVVKGPIGATVILSAVGEAVFDESGTGTYQSVLNESGEVNFKLRSTTQGNSEISAEAMSSPGVSVSQLVRFGPYVKGNGNINYLNYSTGAPANGITPCSVYLKMAQSSDFRVEITYVRVSVNGTATIDGYSGQSADILLNADKSVEIDIINSVAETVNVELSLPESSGSINRFSLLFRTF